MLVSGSTFMSGGPDIAETSRAATEAYGTNPLTPPMVMLACGGVSACAKAATWTFCSI